MERLQGILSGKKRDRKKGGRMNIDEIYNMAYEAQELAMKQHLTIYQEEHLPNDEFIKQIYVGLKNITDELFKLRREQWDKKINTQLKI